MKARLTVLVSMIVLLPAAFLLASCGSESSADYGPDLGTDADSDGDSDSDADSDADSDSDSDTDTAMDPMPSMEPCEGGYEDTIAHLCWQDPPAGDSSDWASAGPYCENLDLGGHDDWRLPSIQELVSLIRGCVDAVSSDQLFASTCGVSYPDHLSGGEGSAVGCEPCDLVGGPGADGWYQDPLLAGPGVSYYHFWSSSQTSATEETTQAWTVTFDDGDVSAHQKNDDIAVRCVRDHG